MLFNSYEFLFVFLPLTWGIWVLLNRACTRRVVNGFLAAASLVFYGFWNPHFVLILLGSIAVNFLIAAQVGTSRGIRKKPFFLAGLGFNLLLLGYYKYAGFLGFEGAALLLPLGISFYTFQQISYLVDTYQGRAHEPDFITYGLFVTFFPHCIAGPIVHHREMMPQFGQRVFRISEHVAIGMTLFVLGLFKKLVIADTVGAQATPIFSLAAQGYTPSLLEAWGAALCYTFQIYFDFSGYSDMAVGLARMFGIRLPMNFASPYKAVSFIDFWQRWHITLSRFLRDYIYIPLGGNRSGRGRQLVNVMLTLLIGGFWHGASWMMIMWGAMHGALLAMNRILRWMPFPTLPVPLARSLVFVVIVLTWVPFRSESWEGMVRMYDGMLALNGITLPSALEIFLPVPTQYFGMLAFDGAQVLIAVTVLLVVVWGLPNSYQWMQRSAPALPVEGYVATQLPSRPDDIAWQPTCAHACIIALLFFLSLLKLTDVSEFLYFQF